jgi:hypothetical protein
MTDIVEYLMMRRADGALFNPSGPTAADTIATLRATNERLNRELDDVWDALAIQREDNGSFGDAFKRMTSEIERLRVVLRETVAWADRHGKDPDWLDAARAALAEEKPNDR